jgi:hypothetical protein
MAVDLPASDIPALATQASHLAGARPAHTPWSHPPLSLPGPQQSPIRDCHRHGVSTIAKHCSPHASVLAQSSMTADRLPLCK